MEFFVLVMVEERDTGWLTELVKKGLHQAVEILDNYGIDSETDVSVLDQDDLSNLVSRDLKSLDDKKLQRWCDAVWLRILMWSECVWFHILM